jgi:hypothetical protein
MASLMESDLLYEKMNELLNMLCYAYNPHMHFWRDSETKHSEMAEWENTGVSFTVLRKLKEEIQNIIDQIELSNPPEELDWMVAFRDVINGLKF